MVAKYSGREKCHRIFAQYIKECQNCIIWHFMAFLLINKLWKNAHLATMTFRVAGKPPFSACLKRPLAYTRWEIPYNACPAGNYDFPIYFGPSSIAIGWDNEGPSKWLSGSLLIIQQWGRDRKTLWWKAAFPQKILLGKGGGYPMHAIYAEPAMIMQEKDLGLFLLVMTVVVLSLKPKEPKKGAFQATQVFFCAS